DNLSKNLTFDDFVHTRKYYKNLSDDKVKLLIKKGVYPYDYMNSWDRFNETNLPSIQSFYSRLSESNISESSYEHAKTIWNTFNIKNLGEYSDLYLKTDVLLLADVVEKFRRTCMEYYKL